MPTRQEIFTDAPLAARRLLRRAVSAVLATGDASINAAHHGAPSASLVTIATNTCGSPLMLLSDIAHHTQNLAADERAALLIDGTEGFSNPQEGPRVTFSGSIRKTRHAADHGRFLARHPNAASYADFADFNFYKMAVDRVHFVGGFASAYWLSARRVLLRRDNCRDIALIESEVVQHMNDNHGDALRLIGQNLIGRRGKHWWMTGIDPDGMDMRCGVSRHRLDFDRPIYSAAACRKILIELTAKARAKNS